MAPRVRTPEREVLLPTRGDTRRLGRLLGRLVQAGDLLVLEGDLGAGKTFLCRALARGLGVPPDVRVNSPTFALVHELQGRLPLLHVDLYRLGDASELQELGLVERISRDAVVAVEWGGRFASELGHDRLEVTLLENGQGQRKARLLATGPRSERLFAALAPHLDLAR